MSVVTFPAALAPYIRKFTLSQVRLDLSFSSMLGSQAVEVGSPLWAVKLEFDSFTSVLSGSLEAMLMKLKGQTNQLELYNAGRPAPVGTMRGTMTLSVAASQGDVVLNITAGAGQAGTTLKAGDMLGIGTGTNKQLVMVTDDATADGSGVIAVNLHTSLRAAHLIGAAVTWDKPTAYFRRTKASPSWTYENVNVSGFTLDLIEDVRS